MRHREKKTKQQKKQQQKNNNTTNNKNYIPIVWNMCEHLHYESVYFKELHNEQEYY